MRPIKILISSLLILFCFYNANAQLKASFKATKYEGCSPLLDTFINTTTGASASAIYNWNFGNGNSSTSKDSVKAVFVNQQTYTVILTVIDKGITSIDSAHITVDQDPTLSFIVNDSVGCSPLSVTFTSTATVGLGHIKNYFFDFGDGFTISGDSETVSHTYSATGKFTVKFDVKTTAGCTNNSLVKPNFIDVLQSPKAVYKRNKNNLCVLGDSVLFTNLSSSLQQPTYVWAFGDGSTATSISPTHSYSTIGIYQDSLIVTNSNGCSDTAISSTPIYLESFKSNFTTNGLCANSNASFTNISVPMPDSSLWYFGNQKNGVIGNTVTNIFDTPGVFNVQLINTYGTCYDTINQLVTLLPQLLIDGFSISNTPLCGGKSMVNLKDTTSGSVEWMWSIKDINGTVATPTAQYQLPNNNSYAITLTVTKTSGCIASVTDTLKLPPNPVKIVTKTNNNISDTSGCAGLVVNFSATPTNGIVSYSWNFGDGSTTVSDSATIHTYNNVGIYPVSLIYTTADGCLDTALSEIHTYLKPSPLFYTLDTLNCGNKANFYDTSKTPTTAWIWYFGDNLEMNYNQNPVHFFSDTGYYTIKFIAYNGTCFDSVTYKNYIHILAPLLNVDTIRYPCNGLRDTANFLTSSRYVQSKLTLSFGDNSTDAIFDTIVHQISHVYAKTGTYRSILSGTNFTTGCTTHDIAWVNILYKQYPILSTNVSSICENDSIKVNIDTNTLAKNPASSGNNYYNIYRWQYGDTNIIFSGILHQQPQWYNSYLGYLKGLSPGQNQLRAITQSDFYGCLDTTNYINLQVKGPIVGYYINNPQDCFRQPLIFNDTSKPTFNSAIVQWIWGFGDNNFDTSTVGTTVAHTYTNPGKFATFLKVTDSAGCYALASAVDTARPSGPKASFTWTPKYIISGTTATFNNTSNTFEDKIVDYQWTFTSNHLVVTTKNASNSYTIPLMDTVTLIATAPANGCTDTSIHIIPIKQVFALFTYNVKYINNNNCPPLIAFFTSHSVNADQLRWDFGDGTPGSGLITGSVVSHTYNLPGVYVITLYAYKNKQLVDSLSQTISVKGAYAKIKSNITQGCVPLTISLFSRQVNSVSFDWDFGDGVIVSGIDTVQSHQYKNAGLFYPQVILTDVNGCKSSFSSPKPIFVDSLNASFTTNLKTICDSATVFFIPKIASFSGTVLDSPLHYHWYLGTGNPKDTSTVVSPSHYYYLGTYPTSLKVTTVAGCTSTIYDTIAVVRSARASIAGPLKVCDRLPVSFTGSIKTQDTIAWKWYFGNGETSPLQNPLSVYFTTPKDSVTIDTIKLITAFNNCYDTTFAKIVIYPKPFVNLQRNAIRICEGKLDTLSAFDGKVGGYKWSSIPIIPFSNINDSVIKVEPHVGSTYFVSVTNQYGCINTDSTSIDVQQYLTINYPKDTFVCKGLSIELPISGATNYAWLADSATLSKTSINPSHPTVTPVNPVTIYKFVASDQYDCFHDTGTIKVDVEKFPTLSTVSSLIVLTGDSVKLTTRASLDVVSYSWSPTTYLGCADCAMPFCAPKSNIVYTVTAKNKYDCAVDATINVNIVCSHSVFLPDAFTPYGSNPMFYPVGKGIKVIKYLKVFNRNGNLLFQRENIQVNDATAGWDGRYNGKLQESGTYVYTAQAQCDTGDIIPLKGTVVLIR